MKALIIVDMQNDFMPGGALGVQGADKLVPIINALIPKFDYVIACLDWHPKDHVSFASNHPGKKVRDVIQVASKPQILWPVHCVQGTFGSELVSGLKKEKIVAYFQKGTEKDVDSYSAFFDNSRLRETGLADDLRARNVKDIYFVGVATEYCVLFSALDAIDLGFSVHVIANACLPINLKPNDEKEALEGIALKGGKIVKM